MAIVSEFRVLFEVTSNVLVQAFLLYGSIRKQLLQHHLMFNKNWFPMYRVKLY